MAHPPLIFSRTIGGIRSKITNDNNTERRGIHSSANRAVESSMRSDHSNSGHLLWPMPHGTAPRSKGPDKTVGNRTSLQIGNVAMENL